MDKRDFGEIRKLIRSVWKDAIESKDSADSWYSSMKRYGYEQIRSAVLRYIETEKFEPKPADIICLIPTGHSKTVFDPTPKFEEIGGQKVRVYVCPRCKDSGMYTWEDADQRVYGNPCDCPAGHFFYSWGWLTEDEQKESVARTGRGADRIGECWYEKR